MLSNCRALIGHVDTARNNSVMEISFFNTRSSTFNDVEFDQHENEVDEHFN